MILKNTWPRIRSAMVHGLKRYLVDARPIGKREYFITREQAQGRANTLRIEAHNQQGVEVTASQQADAREALRILTDTGYTLTDAARALIKSLEKRSDKKIQLCANEYLIYKKEQFDNKQIRPKTYSELDSRIKMFSDVFGSRSINSLTHMHIETWLEDLKVSDKTKQNNLTKVSQFFNWCLKKDYIDKNPCERVDLRLSRVREEVSVLSIEECKTLLKAVEQSPHKNAIKAYVYLGLFCGLRPGEAAAFDWKDFNHGQLFIRGSTSKTKEDRFIHPEPMVLKALERLNIKGRSTGINFRRRWTAIKKAAGWMTESKPWPDDVLRHTFASYWLPIYNDRNKLAEEMGNSVGVIRKHYRRAIPKQIAEEFWKLI